MAVIAPWLKAADTLGASEAGARVGLQERSQELSEKSQADQVTLEQQRLAQQAQQAAQQFQLEQSRLEAAQQQTAVQNQTNMMLANRDYQMKQAQLATQNAYKQQQLDLVKNTQQLKQAQFMQSVSDRAGFLNAIKNGVDPKTAYMQFPHALNAGQYRDLFGAPKLGGDTGKPQMDEFDKKKLDSLTALHDAAAKKSQTTNSDGETVINADQARAANNYQKQIDDLQSKYNQPAAQPTGMAGAMTQTAPQPPQQGTVATPMGGAPETPAPANGAVPPGTGTPAPADPNASTFKKGQQAVQNGVTYEYDGANWNPASS